MTEIIGAFQTPIAVSTIDLPNIGHLVWSRNQRFWQTAPNLQKDKHLTNFKNTILKSVTDFASKIGYADNEFTITQMWANRYEGYETIHTHHHANSFFSGVVYFDDVGSTVLLRESNVKNILQMPINVETHFTNNHYEIPSSPGRLLIFPSYLVHHSTNQSNLPRTTVSFNIMPKKLGDYDQFNYVELADS